MADQRQVLRGPSLWAMPCWLVAVVVWVLAVLSLLWTAGASPGDRAEGIAITVAAAVLGAAALMLRRGTCVVIADGTVTDKVMFLRLWSTSQARVRAAHVAAGPWRGYVLELDDGSARTLLGAGPLQFPARLYDRDGRSDLHELDLLVGATPLAAH